MTLRVLAKYALTWAFWHTPPAEPADAPPLRLYSGRCLHVGIRPHGDPGEGAITVQVTVCSPF